MVNIRRGWTIPARPEQADGEERRQRRLLDTEFRRWAERAPQPSPKPEEEGPIRLAQTQGMLNLRAPTIGPGPRRAPPPPDPLRELAEGFAPPPSGAFDRAPLSAFGQLEERRVQRGGEGARQFFESIQGLDLREVAQLMGLAEVARQRGVTPQQLVAQLGETEFERTNLQREVQLASRPFLEQLAPSGDPLAVGKRFGLGALRLAEEAEELSRRTAAPVTRPVGRAVTQVATEAAVPQVPRPLRALGVPEFPGREAFREQAGEVGEVAGEFGLSPVNLIPIPIADDILRVLAKGVPIAARLLTRTGREATRAELRELAAGARRFLSRTPPTDPAERRVVEEAVETLSREAVAEGGSFEARLAAQEAESSARKARVEAGVGPVRESQTEAQRGTSVFLEAEAGRLGKEERAAALRAGQAANIREWRKNPLGEEYARMRDDIRGDYIQARIDEGDPVTTFTPEQEQVFLSNGEQYRPPRAAAAEEVAPVVAREAAPPARAAGDVAEEVRLGALTREEFDQAVLYRGVSDRTATGPNEFWTDDLELARMHARGGANPRIRVMLRKDIPKQAIAKRTEMGLEPTSLDEALKFHALSGLQISQRDFGPTRILAEFPANVDPFDAIRGGRAPARAAGEPTVRQVDLEGREIDTFATEREFGGVRERQAGLPMGAGELPTETAGPLFRAVPSPADDALRDIAEERRLAQAVLGDPASRRQAGALAETRTRLAALDREEAIIRNWQQRRLSPERQALELRELEEGLANQAARAGVREPGRATTRQPAFGTAEAAEFEFARRGRPSARQARATRGRELSAAEVEVEGVALDAVGARLNLPPIGGGAPLTRNRVLARQITEQTDEAQNAIGPAMASPHREARESWRLYAGANNEAAIQRAAWRENTYDLFDDVGIAINRNSDDQADNAIELLERAFGDEAARAPVGQFLPQERAAAQALYGRLDDATERLLVADPDFQFKALDEYFPHQFKKQPQPLRERLRGRRGLQLAPGFAKRRKLEGMLGEILESRPDLDLATWDPVAYVDRHIAAVDNYINSLETIRGLRAKGLIVPRSGAPASWRTPDVASFKIGEKLQGWVAEPKVAQTLEQMFGRSAFDQHGALRIAKTVRETAFRAKVFGGLFQQIDYAFRDAGLGLSELVQARPKGAVRAWASPLRAVARMVNPGLDRRLTTLAAKNPELRLLYRNGLAAGFDPSIGDKAIRAEGTAFSSLPGVQQVLDYMGGGAYERFHRETLEQAGLVNLQKFIKRGFSQDEAARRAVEETNVFFSSIPNWQSAIRSKTGRDLIKFPFFATGELEGWFRLPFQAPGGFAGIIGATAIMAEMLNKMFTGDWLSTDQLKPYKDEPPRGLVGKVLPISYNSHFLRPLLPWKGADGRDLYLDMLGQSDTPFRWALDPQFATQTRLGQFPRLGLDIGEISHGEAPAFGEQIKGPLDWLQFGFQQVSPIGISALTGTEAERIGRLGAAVQTSGLNVSAQTQRDRFAVLYQEKYGTAPQLDISPRQLDPELAAQAGYDPARETEFGQERAGITAGEEGRLADLSRIVLTGQPDAMEQFEEELGDFFRFRSGVTETLVRELGLPEREASLVQDFYDLDPRDRRDPETGKPDWDHFESQRERVLSQLRREGPSGREAASALERGTGISFPDPDLQRVYDARRTLREGLDAYYDTDSKKREAYRRRNPEVDAKLYLLGRVSRVVTSAAQREVRSLSRRLLGTEVEAGRGERRERRFGEPIRIGSGEPIAIGR